MAKCRQNSPPEFAASFDYVFSWYACRLPHFEVPRVYIHWLMYINRRATTTLDPVCPRKAGHAPLILRRKVMAGVRPSRIRTRMPEHTFTSIVLQATEYYRISVYIIWLVHTPTTGYYKATMLPISDLLGYSYTPCCCDKVPSAQ